MRRRGQAQRREGFYAAILQPSFSIFDLSLGVRTTTMGGFSGFLFGRGWCRAFLEACRLYVSVSACSSLVVRSHPNLGRLSGLLIALRMARSFCKTRSSESSKVSFGPTENISVWLFHVITILGEQAGIRSNANHKVISIIYDPLPKVIAHKARVAAKQ